MTKLEILHFLDCNTHTLLTPEFVDEVNEAFGVKIASRWNVADGHENPKGLTMKDGSKGGRGLAAFELAPELCDALGVKYRDCLGRGFQVRACTDAIRDAGKAA